MSSKSSTFPLYESEDCKHLSPSLTRIIDGIIAKIDSLLKKVSASSEYSLPSSQRDCLEKIRNYLKTRGTLRSAVKIEDEVNCRVRLERQLIKAS